MVMARRDCRKGTHISKTAANGRLHVQSVFGRIFCSNVNILTFQPALADGSTCFELVPVSLSGV
jgi:hypothetical protein